MDLLLIGRQVRTDRGIVDLLALDSNGNTVIIELKRNESPRGIVSQAISYCSHFHRNGNLEQLNKIAENHFGQISDEGLLIRKKFKEKFGHFPTTLNGKQIIVLVAEHFPNEVLDDLKRVADHICIEFSYFKSHNEEEYFSTKRVSGAEINQEAISQKPTILQEFDPFFKQVVENVKKLLPQPLTTFKNTNAHEKREQWIRFHWGGTDAHIGLWVRKNPTGNEISVYFTNWSRDPKIIQLLKRKSAELQKKLKPDTYDYAKKSAAIDKSIGELTEGNHTEMVEIASQTIATFISALKPILEDML